MKSQTLALITPAELPPPPQGEARSGGGTGWG